MSVVQPGGDKQPGGKPGPGRGPGDRPASGQRPPQKPGQRPPSSGRRPQAKPGSGPGGRGPQRPAGRPSGKAQAGKRVGTPVAARPPRRFSPANMAYVVIAVVVVAIVALVVVKVAGGGSTNNSSSLAPVLTTAPPSLVNQVTSVPPSVENAVGVPSSSLVTPPQVAKNQSPLVSDGKPSTLFVGALFCPYCAAMRWPIVVAFSRFGTFSGLKETTSSPWDTDPSTATLPFYGATYTSNYVSFAGVEHESNDKDGLGTHTTLLALTNQQSSLWAKYAAMFGTSEGYPFMDIGNKVFVLGPLYNPQLLSGLNQSDIAALLTDANSQVTQAIVGTANYLTAGICSTTGQMPTAVCGATAITQADKALGLSS